MFHHFSLDFFTGVSAGRAVLRVRLKRFNGHRSNRCLYPTTAEADNDMVVWFQISTVSQDTPSFVGDDAETAGQYGVWIEKGQAGSKAGEVG